MCQEDCKWLDAQPYKMRTIPKYEGQPENKFTFGFLVFIYNKNR